MNNTMKYIGKKEVLAERMNELKAVELGYARPNEDNHEWREGYHVVYEDGYHSWSPLDVFNSAYQLAETFIDRMRIELKELEECKHKAEKFNEEQIHFPSTLNWEDKSLLSAQINSMDSYRSILKIRLMKAEAQEKHIRLMEAEAQEGHNCCCCEPCSEI